MCRGARKKSLFLTRQVFTRRTTHKGSRGRKKINKKVFFWEKGKKQLSQNKNIYNHNYLIG